MIPCQVQDALVGLGRQSELVFCFLDVAQADGRQEGKEDIPECLAERNGFGIGPAGCGTVSLELVGKPQRPVSGRAERQVVGVQILQARRDWASMGSTWY